MKVKTLKLMGTAAFFAVAMFVNASLSTGDRAQDVSLLDLAGASEANAECVSGGSLDFGRCLGLSQVCVFSVDSSGCNPYAW